MKWKNKDKFKTNILIKLIDTKTTTIWNTDKNAPLWVFDYMRSVENGKRTR